MDENNQHIFDDMDVTSKKNRTDFDSVFSLAI